uniref:Uncharacterized protein n=1 Tax=Parascaris equorum TaxID=6256 RepID=A0A914S1K8_PAREQ
MIQGSLIIPSAGFMLPLRPGVPFFPGAPSFPFLPSSPGCPGAPTGPCWHVQQLEVLTGSRCTMTSLSTGTGYVGSGSP